MLSSPVLAAAKPAKRFSVALARHSDEVREAQALRWTVFAGEYGARLRSPQVGLDIDRFDAHCEHLIVRDCVTDKVVGTYRMLTAAAAAATGGFYSEQEFDIGALGALRPGLVEMGRSCVHADYRNGVIIALLWSGLGDFMARCGARTLIGCASIPLSDGGHQAASIFTHAFRKHASPDEHRVRPHDPLPLHALDTTRDPTPPTLIKGYLRSGAMICGDPAWDRDFKTADMFMMLHLDAMEERHARHFQRVAPPAAA